MKVPSGLTTGSADLVMKDLTREIEVMSRLNHPHIVKLYGITHSQWTSKCTVEPLIEDTSNTPTPKEDNLSIMDR